MLTCLGKAIYSVSPQNNAIRKSKLETRLLLFAVFVFFLGDYHLGIEAKSHSPAFILLPKLKVSDTPIKILGESFAGAGGSIGRLSSHQTPDPLADQPF